MLKTNSKENPKHTYAEINLLEMQNYFLPRGMGKGVGGGGTVVPPADKTYLLLYDQELFVSLSVLLQLTEMYNSSKIRKGIYHHRIS